MKASLGMGLFVKFFLAATIMGMIAVTLISQKSSPLPQIKDEWWGDDAVPQVEDESIRPFKIEIPDEVPLFYSTYYRALPFISFSAGYRRSPPKTEHACSNSCSLERCWIHLWGQLTVPRNSTEILAGILQLERAGILLEFIPAFQDQHFWAGYPLHAYQATKYNQKDPAAADDARLARLVRRISENHSRAHRGINAGELCL